LSRSQPLRPKIADYRIRVLLQTFSVSGKRRDTGGCGQKGAPIGKLSKAVSYAFKIFRPDCALRDTVRRLIGDDRAPDKVGYEFARLLINR
jgi:hypothetical protein